MSSSVAKMGERGIRFVVNTKSYSFRFKKVEDRDECFASLDGWQASEASVAKQAVLMEKAHAMKQQKQVCKTCQSCEHPFQKAGEQRSPLVFDCLCVFCADCAATEEAKHLAVNDCMTVADGIPCFDCKRSRTTPISKLKFPPPTHRSSD